jgi:hypothetical protein
VVSLGFFCLLVCIFIILNIWVVIHTFLWYMLFPQTRQYNSCIRNGGNGILKHAGLETTGSSPTTGVTMLWACNPLGEFQTTGKSHKKKSDRLYVRNNTEKYISG